MMEKKDTIPTPNKSGKYPTLIDLLAILGLFFVSQVITATIFQLIGLTSISIDAITQLSRELQRAAEHDMGRVTLLWTVVSQSLFLLMLMLYRAVRHGGWRSVRFSYRGFNPTILLLGVIMLVALSIVMEPLLNLFPDPSIPIGRGAYMIVAIVVVVPIFEELICRGIILESVRRKWGAWAGCGASALIFGLMHVQPPLIINAVAMGLILGYIYLRTGSIFAPIILHSINNLLAYIFIIFGISQLSVADIVGNRSIYILIYAVAVGVMILAVIYMSRRLRILDREAKLSESK